MTARPLRFGILGAARIAPNALIKPARRVKNVEVAAIAARNREKAEAFARKHGLPKSYAAYDDLLADPEIDAIYIALPNSLHGYWTIRALQAGKAVLCEKPGAANRAEAQQVAVAVKETGLLMMEAYHWRYHALATRIRQLIDEGAIGSLQKVSMQMCFPLLSRKDIRWQWPLAGGALMDCCYTVSILRFLAAAEPVVLNAQSKLWSEQIDRYTRAELKFSNGVKGEIEASMLSHRLLNMQAHIHGDAGEMRIVNPILPQLYHRLVLTNGHGKRSERVPGVPSYQAQLEAFAQAWRDGAEPLTNVNEMVRNMTVIDTIYRQAGLEPRRPYQANQTCHGP